MPLIPAVTRIPRFLPRPPPPTEILAAKRKNMQKSAQLLLLQPPPCLAIQGTYMEEKRARRKEAVQCQDGLP